MVRQADQAEGRYCILDIPLLVENQLQDTVDRVLVVDVPAETQVARLRQRDHCSAEEAAAIMAAQATREERLTVADDVIDNSGDETALRLQVQELHERYTKLAERAAP